MTINAFKVHNTNTAPARSAEIFDSVQKAWGFVPNLHRVLLKAPPHSKPTPPCGWLRRGPNTLSLLQELGYIYHIDDLSRDEPFIEQVNGKDFVVVPYTLRNNDILLIEGRNYSPLGVPGADQAGL